MRGSNVSYSYTSFSLESLYNIGRSSTKFLRPIFSTMTQNAIIRSVGIFCNIRRQNLEFKTPHYASKRSVVLVRSIQGTVKKKEQPCIDVIWNPKKFSPTLKLEDAVHFRAEVKFSKKKFLHLEIGLRKKFLSKFSCIASSSYTRGHFGFPCQPL